MKKIKLPSIMAGAIFLIFSLYYIYYCNSYMVELPHLSWFDQIPLADLFYTGELKVTDVVNLYAEHGMLGNNILFLINVVFFSGTTMFDVVINDFNVILCASIIIWHTYKTLEGRKGWIFWIAIEAFFMFTCMQLSAGAMETQVRLGILFFLLAMVNVDKQFREGEALAKRHLFLTVVVMLLSIHVFGTLYSFAGVPCVWLITVFYIIRNKKMNKRHLLISGIYFLSIPLYMIEYRFFLNRTREGSLFEVFQHLAKFIKGVFAWCANGVLGWAYHESTAYDSRFFLGIGAIVLMIVLLSILLFFKFEMYKKTWLPIMCILYSFGVFVMIYIGRASVIQAQEDGWEWFANEWYNVHLKIMIAASVWIYAYICGSKKWRYVIALSCVGFLVAVSTVGSVYHWKRVPAVRNYYQEKQKYLFIQDESSMPVDESGNTPLLESLDKTMNAIDILKRYNLSVYKYWDIYEQAQELK